MATKTLNADRLKTAHSAVVEVMECRPDISDADAKVLSRTLSILDGLFADLLA